MVIPETTPGILRGKITLRSTAKLPQPRSRAASSSHTFLGMRIDLKTKRPVVANVMGGFSGPAVFPMALRMVYQVSRAVNIPVIGCGGVMSADDILEMMLAGAKAVEVGTANLIDPLACYNMVRDLPTAMERYGIDSLSSIKPI